MQELLGVLVAMLSSRGQVGNGFLVVTFNLSAVKIQLSELIFSVVVSVLCGDLKVLDGSEDVLDIFFGEKHFACKVGGVRVPLTCGSFEIVDGSLQVLWDDLAL